MSSIQSRGPTQLTFIHFILLFLFSWFIFYNSDGKFQIVGDDVVHLQPAFEISTLKPDRIIPFLQSRWFLGVSQNTLYHLVGSYQACQVIYLIIYVVSVFVWYLVLRTLFVENAAFIGALFFLVYSGKYESLTEWSQGMYPVVMLLGILVFGASLWISNPWLKALVMALLLWASLPFYEVLIMIPPIFPLIFLGRCWFEKRYPRVSDIVLAFATFIPCIVHMAIISDSSQPIWLRNKTGGDFDIPIYEKLSLAFVRVLDKTIGPTHFHELYHGIGSFFLITDQHPFGYKALLVLFIVAAVLTLLSLLLTSTIKVSGPRFSVDRTLYGLAGLYIFLFSGMISFILGTVVPSRMTFLPSLGLSIVICYVAHQLIAYPLPRFGVSRLSVLFLRAVGVVVLALFCFSEAITLCAVVKECETTYVYDQGITDQIIALRPQIPDGSVLYVSLDYPILSKMNYWNEASSVYENGSAVGMIWNAYHAPVNSIEYMKDTRFPEYEPPFSYPRLLARYNAQTQAHLYPFFITKDVVVKGIQKIQVIGADGKTVVKELVFPAMANLPPEDAVTLQSPLNQQQ